MTKCGRFTWVGALSCLIGLLSLAPSTVQQRRGILKVYHWVSPATMSIHVSLADWPHRSWSNTPQSLLPHQLPALTASDSSVWLRDQRFINFCAGISVSQQSQVDATPFVIDYCDQPYDLRLCGDWTDDRFVRLVHVPSRC